MLVAQLGEMFVEVFGDAILNRAVEVGAEARGHVGAHDRVALEDRNVRREIVAAELAELGGEILRPREFAALPTVGPEIREIAPGFFGRVEDRFTEMLEMIVERGGT